MGRIAKPKPPKRGRPKKKKEKKYVATHCTEKGCKECQKELTRMRVAAYYQRWKDKGLREVHAAHQRTSVARKKAAQGLESGFYEPVQEVAKPTLGTGLLTKRKKLKVTLHDVWIVIPGQAPQLESVTMHLLDYKHHGKEYIGHTIQRLLTQGYTAEALAGTQLRVTRRPKNEILYQCTWNQKLELG